MDLNKAAPSHIFMQWLAAALLLIYSDRIAQDFHLIPFEADQKFFCLALKKFLYLFLLTITDMFLLDKSHLSWFISLFFPNSPLKIPEVFVSKSTP